MLGWRFKMRVWWCVALCVCARAARPGPGPAGGDLTPAQPRDGDLTPEVIQQAIEMEMEDASEQDPMLVALRGAGRTRAALCGRGRGCAGALWGRRWLLTRASCAAALQPRHAAVLPHRGVASCRPDAPESGGIPVLARFVHPQYSGAESAAGGAHDAALLLLAAPAPVPPHTNHSRALLLVPELERWLQYVPAVLPASWDRPPARARGADVARLRLTSSPLRLLAAAVLLPAAALLLLFALALRLPPSPPAPPYGLLDPDALEHAQPPPHHDDKPDAPLDSPTAERLAFL